ncbi:MAG TPA: RnfABCDGE type electron transport complex subunit D, partial [Candidatus Krumholzibacterium sp.]|nr:RnfABCDGE type electron transport complex subunit D [Candidatus Krumholzibacterium sp.]
GPRFIVSSSPHLHDGRTVTSIMRLVVWALLPATLFAVYAFGLSALRVILVSVASAMLFEAVSQKVMGKRIRVADFSAVLTGLLLALNLPSTSPWWLVVTGNFFAIVIAKQLYGGLGYNPFNPALVGRVVLLVSFPVHMTARWVAATPLGRMPFGVDAVTTATPLGMAKESLATLGHIDVPFGAEQITNLLLGTRAGCLGEVSVVLLLLGGLFLIFKKVISWHIPVSFIGTVWVLTGIFFLIDPTKYANPTFHVISGGLWLGALFMATDYVTSPVSRKGMLIFGAGCGLITVLIRLWGGYPEGVSFAILLMNAATPLIDRYTKPAVFGAVKKEKAAA